jgi:hypothetical protein
MSLIDAHTKTRLSPRTPHLAPPPPRGTASIEKRKKKRRERRKRITNLSFTPVIGAKENSGRRVPAGGAASESQGAGAPGKPAGADALHGRESSESAIVGSSITESSREEIARPRGKGDPAARGYLSGLRSPAENDAPETSKEVQIRKYNLVPVMRITCNLFVVSFDKFSRLEQQSPEGH